MLSGKRQKRGTLAESRSNVFRESVADLSSFIHSFINLFISSLGPAHFLPAVTPAQQKDAKHSKTKYKYFKNESQKKSSPDIRETLRASAEQDNASQTDKKKKRAAVPEETKHPI